EPLLPLHLGLGLHGAGGHLPTQRPGAGGDGGLRLAGRRVLGVECAALPPLPHRGSLPHGGGESPGGGFLGDVHPGEEVGLDGHRAMLGHDAFAVHPALPVALRVWRCRGAPEAGHRALRLLGP
ncbi:unnamed protein product, partial [Effrenium voratum]